MGDDGSQRKIAIYYEAANPPREMWTKAIKLADLVIKKR